MKKTLALLLCLAMLVTALSVNVFAATTPTVEVVTHESTATGATTFAIKISGVDSLKGIDLTVTGDDGIDMTDAVVSALNTKSTLVAGENYTISEDGHTLHIVELSNDLTGDIITVAAHVDVDGEAHNITVTGELAKSGTELYDSVTFTPGAIAPYVKSEDVTVIVPDGETETTVTQETAGEDYFIPYGSVYETNEDGTYKYADKDENGSFKVNANTTVAKFPVPDNGFGTYGVSDSVVGTTPAKQFGNYVEAYVDTNDYGTFVIMGDWAAYRDWYLSKKAYSDADLIKMLYNSYKSKKANGDERTYIPYGIKGQDCVIQVVDVEQINWLWKNSTQLEYGVRVKGLVDGSEYATVAYYNDGTDTTFAKEIRAEKYNAQ